MRQLQTIMAVLAMMIILGLILVLDPFEIVSFQSHAQASKIMLQANPGPEWDASVVTSSSVLYDRGSNTFKMWYVGNGAFERSGIGYAESSDGVNWTPHTSSPVIESEPIDPTEVKNYTWDAGGVRTVSVIKSGNAYKMWYSAEEWQGNGEIQVGYAESRDGLNWSKYSGNPIFSAADGSWDSHSVTEPHVLQDGTNYRMWYTGIPKDTDGSRTDLSAIGYAESSNGVNWERVQSVPVVQARKKAWNSERVSGPTVISHNNGSVYEMWFSGSDGGNAQLGRAYSQDGVNWAEEELNPLVQDDKDEFFDPFVAAVDQQYYIWLTRFEVGQVPEYSLQFTSWPSDDPSDLGFVPSEVPQF